MSSFAVFYDLIPDSILAGEVISFKETADRFSLFKVADDWYFFSLEAAEESDFYDLIDNSFVLGVLEV